MRQEYCHTFNLSSGVSISICSYHVRPHVTESCSHSLTKTIHHHHCIYLAHTYYVCCTGVDSLKGWVNRKKYMFPPDTAQHYSLPCAVLQCCPLAFAAAQLQSWLLADQGVLFTWGAALLPGGPMCCLRLHGKRDMRRGLLGAQGLLQYGVGKLEGLGLSEVTLGVVCLCSSNSR